jgi:hypothetical protein
MLLFRFIKNHRFWLFNYFRIEELQFWLFEENWNERTISPSHFKNLKEPVIPCKNRQRTDSYGRLFNFKKIGNRNYVSEPVI